MEVLKEWAAWIAMLIPAAMTLFEVSKIKINPWSWLAKKVGKAVNGEVLEKFDQLKEDVTEIKTQQEEHSAKDSRMRILRFGDEMLHGENHSKDHFDQILDDVNRYELYCETHPLFINNMTRLTISRIKAEYQERLFNNTFL